MPADVRSQLGHLGEAMLRDSAPVTFDDITASPIDTTSSVRSFRRPVHPRKSGRAMSTAVALAGAAAVLVGLVVIADRPDSNPRADEPVSSTVPQPMAPAGSIVLGDGFDDWTIDDVGDSRDFTSVVFEHRIYTTDDPQPENGPALVVTSYDADAGAPYLDDATGTTVVQGVEAHLVDRPPDALGVAFELDGYWYDLTGYNLTESKLLTAAAATTRSPDEFGAVIAPSALPDGVNVETSGVMGESWFITRDALGSPISHARWTNGDQSVWYQSLAHDPALDRFQRIGAATVTDTDVNGHTAFIRTLPDNNAYRSITWHEDGRTRVLESLNVTDDQLVDFAQALRPATASEWDEITAALAPPVACTGDQCAGAPEPGSIIPAGVNVFPAIDERLVPDDGRGPTSARYGHYSSVLTGGGSTWVGVIGAPSDSMYDDLITVSVSKTEDAEQLPVEPGPTPDVGEYVYGSGVQLVKTYPSDVSVIVQGRDIDVLHEVLDNLEPLATDGELVGYELVGDLPAGLTELEPPSERKTNSGSFPSLSVHRGTVTLSINPGPALTHISGWIGPIDTVEVEGRRAFIHELNDTGYITLAIELENGLTLSIESNGLTRPELVDIAAAVELIGEQEWNERYHLSLPIVPGSGSSATTVAPTTEG